jgi:hypothetical protein
MIWHCLLIGCPVCAPRRLRALLPGEWSLSSSCLLLLLLLLRWVLYNLRPFLLLCSIVLLLRRTCRRATGANWVSVRPVCC